MRKRGLAILMTLMLAAACGSERVTAEGALFRSENGFAVRYPSQWVQIGTDNDLGPSSTRLSIISSLPRVRGVVIGEGQAHIFVEKVDDQSSRRLVEIEQLVEDNQMLSRRELSTERGSDGGCDTLHEVVSRFVNPPARPEINHDFICRIGSERFLTRLRYWEGEARADEYRRTASAIARSIRPGGMVN
jgi:hypothetical protein